MSDHQPLIVVCPDEFEGRADSGVSQAIDGGGESFTSYIVGPAHAWMDIDVSRAIEIGGIFLCQEGIGISAVIVEVNVSMAEGTSNHEKMIKFLRRWAE